MVWRSQAMGNVFRPTALLRYASQDRATRVSLLDSPLHVIEDICFFSK